MLTGLRTTATPLASLPRRWKIAGLIVGGLAIASIAVTVQRVAVLTWVGSLLVVEDQLMPADAILPLAGGILDREIEAAELFRSGHAPRVIITTEPEVPTVAYLEGLGVHLPTSNELRLQVFDALGVPRERITVMRGLVRSTFDEARLVAAWAAESGARTVIIVSSPQHTARAKYVFERYAGNPKIRFIVRPSKMGEFRPDTWWTKRAMLREGIIELEKLVAYRLWY